MSCYSKNFQINTVRNYARQISVWHVSRDSCWNQIVLWWQTSFQICWLHLYEWKMQINRTWYITTNGSYENCSSDLAPMSWIWNTTDFWGTFRKSGRQNCNKLVYYFQRVIFRVNGSIVQGTVHGVHWFHSYTLHWWLTYYILFIIWTVQWTRRWNQSVFRLWLQI